MIERKQALLVILGAIIVAGAPCVPPTLATSPPLEDLQALVATADFGPIRRKLLTLIDQASARELLGASLASSGNATKSRRVLKKTIRLLTKADRLLASRRASRTDAGLRSQARALVAAALADLRSRIGGTSGGQTCRTYETAYNTVQALNGQVVANETASCAFSTSTNQLTCSLMHTDTSGCVLNLAFVTSYGSTADFIDEVSVIPPRVLSTEVVFVGSLSGSCAGSEMLTLTYSYDSQRRPTQLVVSSSGQSTTSYSAWDSSGRWTMGTISISNSMISESWSYDDAARTATVTKTDIGGVATVLSTDVVTYDTNGNVTRNVDTSGQTVETRDFTITSTQRVCK